MNKRVVVDASAVLALPGDEPGSKAAAEAIRNGALMSAINAAEVHGKLCDAGVPAEIAVQIVTGLASAWLEAGLSVEVKLIR